MDRPTHPTSKVFTVLCALTILGNLLLIAINLLKFGLLETGIRNGGVGAAAAPYLRALLVVVMLSSAGAAFGAALMLGGKLLGYRIYAVSIGVHLAATVCVMLLWIATVFLFFVAVLLFFYCFIPVGFLLYFRRNKGRLS